MPISIDFMNNIINDLIKFIEYILFKSDNAILLLLFIIFIIIYFITIEYVDISKLLNLIYQNIKFKYILYIIILLLLGYYKQYNIIFFIILLKLIIEFLNNIYESERIDCDNKKCMVMTYPKLILYIFIGIISLLFLTIIWLYIILNISDIIISDFTTKFDLYTIAIIIILAILIYIIYKSLYSCFAFIKSLFKTKKTICNGNNDNNDKEILCYEYSGFINNIKYTYYLIAIMLISYLSIITWNESEKFLNNYFFNY